MTTPRQYRIPTRRRFPRAWVVFALFVAACLMGAKAGGVL